MQLVRPCLADGFAALSEISNADARDFRCPVDLAAILPGDGPDLPSPSHEDHAPPRVRDGYHASCQAIVVERVAYHGVSLLTGFIDPIGLLRHDESCAFPLAISTGAALRPPRRAVGLMHL